jgi:hypothetical protein
MTSCTARLLTVGAEDHAIAAAKSGYERHLVIAVSMCTLESIERFIITTRSDRSN